MKLSNKAADLLNRYFGAYHMEHPEEPPCPNCENWVCLSLENMKKAENLYKEILSVLGHKEINSRRARRDVSKILKLNGK